MATLNKARLRSVKLNKVNVDAMFPGLDPALELSMFPSWSLTKKAPATEGYVGREAIIIRDGGEVVANIFALKEGEKLNAYFPSKKEVHTYSSKRTQIGAINRIIKDLRADREAAASRPAEGNDAPTLF